MASGPSKELQEALYGEDRRPALYASLSFLLVLNNLVVFARFLTHWRAHYRHHRFSFGRIFVDDYLMLLSAICVDVVAANLLASTGYGLGLHSWRINAEDPEYPQNLSNVFKHVWITMVFTGLTFAAIKLSLLYFYRRLFLFKQRWLKIAWWTNFVYVVLWFFGATGFYLFQCWPVQWYFMQYYSRYHKEPPYPIEGQCNATSTTHVALPLIFGLASDIAILLLPLFTISQLHMSKKVKLGLLGVFSIGMLACGLDMGRIIELWVDTDDKIDPSYGVVIFLILSAATEVTAVTCACLPIIGPGILKEYKRRHNPSYNFGYKNSSDRYNNLDHKRGGSSEAELTLTELRRQGSRTDPVEGFKFDLDNDSPPPARSETPKSKRDDIWIDHGIALDYGHGLSSAEESGTRPH